MKRNTRRYSKKQGRKRGHKRSHRSHRVDPLDLIDRANDSYVEIVTVGRLLSVVGAEGDLNMSTIRSSGYMIERQSARLYRYLNLLSLWIAEHPWPERAAAKKGGAS